MRLSLPRGLAAALLWGLGALLQAQGLLPDVQERRLRNGVRVLLVERPGSGAVHARLFLQGGSASTGALPAVASELLAQCLFKPPLEGAAADANLESLLQQEAGAYEALRLAAIREARQPAGTAGEDLQGLELIHQGAFAKLKALEERASRQDPLEALGAVRTELRVDADQVAFGLDLPKESFPSYCRILADRFRTLLLARFPLERERLLANLDDADRRAEDVLLSASLSGHPYGQVDSRQRGSLEALAWADLRAYGRWAVAPERLVLVVVGDLRPAEVEAAVNPTLGTLSPGPPGWGYRGEPAVELSEDAGSRRIQASIPGEKRLLLGWRVPPTTHPDHQGLQVLVQMLAGGASARLPMRFSGDRVQVQSLSVRLDVPGGRDANLLVIEARPIERRGLQELEQIIQGEMIRLQRGAFQEGEIRRAQRQVEVDQLMLQEDAARLAQEMGAAVCQGGDWNLAFRALQHQQDYTQQAIQAIALKYLVPGRSTVVFLEPDPILMPQDDLEARTAAVLKRILSAKLEDPGQVEAVVRDALRQLRMLSQKEREQTLGLLESQVKP